MKKNQLEEALRYRKSGGFPIPKIDLVDTKKYGRRLPSEKEIRSWWAKWPNAKMAVLIDKSFMDVQKEIERLENFK